MPKTAPLIYTVSEEDGVWKVWKGGSLSGRPSRVFDTKREAESHAHRQSDKYNSDGIVLQRQDGRVHDVVQGPNSARMGEDIYRSPEAVIEVEYDEFGNFAWMVISRWDNGLLASGYSRKGQASNHARNMMNTINAKKVLVRNRHDSGTREYWNPAAPEEWKIQGA